MVDGLKNHFIELLSMPLHTNTDRAMTEVRTTCLRDWIVVDVNDAVQIVSDDLGDIV